MAKKQKPTSAAPASEIDDIFGGGSTSASTSKTKLKVDSTSASKVKTGDGKKGKSSKSGDAADKSADGPSDKKRKRNDDASSSTTPAEPTSKVKPKKPKSRAVEVISDTSAPSHTIPQQPPLPASNSTSKSSNAQRRPPADDLDEFTDSRGTSARKRTDDGLRIFTAEELKLGQGGDTPLCPFDCDCCF